VTDVSTKVRDAIFGNVGTMIVFRVGAADAEFLEKEFEPEFVIQDMVNLPNRAIYLKLMCDGMTSRPFSAATLAPFKLKDPVLPDDIIDMTRKRYTRPRSVVEAEVQRWSVNGQAVEEGEGKPKEEGAPDKVLEGYMQSRSRPREYDNNRRMRGQADQGALAKLGIEFDAAAIQPSGARDQDRRGLRPPQNAPYQNRPRNGVPDRPPMNRPAPSWQQNQPPRKPVLTEVAPPKPEVVVPDKPLSLAQLATASSEQKKKHIRPEVDIESLKDAIKGALAKKQHDQEDAPSD
jgi:hypothetical protein